MLMPGSLWSVAYCKNWSTGHVRSDGRDIRANARPHCAALISALLPLGGAGTVLCGMLMDRFNPDCMVAAAYALGALSVFAIGGSQKWGAIDFARSLLRLSLAFA